MRVSGKAVKKADLPEKICPRCGRPVAWRRKWERDWERVIHCSQACKRGAKQLGGDR